MIITNDRARRALQKVQLGRLYPDYDAKRHDAFVIRFNADKEKEYLRMYELARGIQAHQDVKP